jgi:quercetin dioxygenase-like cupin family protein
VVDVRSIEDCAPSLEHEGSTKVWWLVDAREMFDETVGGHLESISEVELPPGSKLAVPDGKRWVFWYVTAGRGRVGLGGREHAIGPGDMVLVRPGQTYELRPASENAALHLLSFAVAKGGVPPSAASYQAPTGIDIRSIEQVRPLRMDSGASVWWLAKPGEFRAATQDGHVELVDEFEVAAGGEVHPHSHPTWEFYYGLFGRALMTISGEERTMGPGDLVVIPSDAVHSIKPIGPHTGIRCFCFAIGIKGAQPYNYGQDAPAEPGR